MAPSRRDLLAASALAAVGACVRRPAEVPAWSPRPTPLPPTFARGFNLAHQHLRGSGYGSDAAARALDALAALGVRDVALNPFAYTPSLGSSEIRWGGDPTLTDEDLRAQVAQARERGLRVLMKPHLWSGAFWTGAGNPDLSATDWPAWFAAYTAYVAHYARLAEETGCDSLCVGLEYTRATLANPGAWAGVAAACRAVFGGRLLYAANWYEEYVRFADWDAFDCVGINAYFPLAGRTVDELADAWGAHLDAIERVARGKPVIFPEAGYRAVTGATEAPWEHGGGTPDAELQARAYEALLRACAARPWFGGVYWWKWFTDAGPDTDAFVPDAPARAVLRAWFG